MKIQFIMNVMEINQNIAEYYDELYPVTDEQKKFYEKKMNNFSAPVKFLRIGCGTGSFEHSLARDGSDVTGIETSPELLESANRKRRTQLMSVRYFHMSSLEMGRFLGKNFYNIISILDGRIAFTHDNTLMAKLFYDCRELISDGGFLIVTLPNFERYTGQEDFYLPLHKSIRASLSSHIAQKDGTFYLNQKLETGNGKKLTVTEDAPINMLIKEDLKKYALDAGFKNVEFFEGFNLAPLTQESQNVLAVIS